MINTPIVLLLFKRVDSTRRIIGRLREVEPTKLYVLCDQGRDENERKLVREVRSVVDECIDWPCEVIRDYADENRGVYDQIGLGALRVFEHEERAIFLEDDNLPESTFFAWCEQMLNVYENNDKIVWVCGTNYLGESRPADGSDIYFTRHLLPCGWASWAAKFRRCYDKEFSLTNEDGWLDRMEASYEDRRLFVQQRESVLGERERRDHGERYRSWDFQMAFSIRMQNLLGVAPSRNQITNIGVDEFSTHGSKTGNTMTDRFCNVPSYPMPVPCHVPAEVKVDEEFERAIGEIILQPWDRRAKDALKRVLGVPRGMSIKQWVLGSRKGA